MALDNCANRDVFNYASSDDDDDVPLTFRRSISVSQKNQVGTSLKKPLSLQKQQNASIQKPNSQKEKMVEAKNVVEKNTLGLGPSASTSQIDHSNIVADSKPSNENGASDDSDDDKPLSARLSSVAKVNKSTSDGGDSEDEVPLSAKYGLKTDKGTSMKSSTNSAGRAQDTNFRQNGSSKQNLSLGKGSNKRAAGEVSNSVSASAAKKIKVQQVSSTKEEEDDHVSLAKRKTTVTVPESKASIKKVTKVVSSATFKKSGKTSKKLTKNSKFSKSIKFPPGSGGGQKWTTLEHNGVIFPPPYNPHGIKICYNGQPVDLTPEQEEVATMFAVMKDTDYATKPKFIENFMNDWRAILGRNHVIKKFELCDFTPIYEWHQREKEKKKQMSSEEKKAAKEEKLMQEERYMWAIVDGVKEKVGNFRVEPPGLFRGRGEHPKMGKLKKRIRPRDITINIGKDAPIPECPIPGERWKEIKHDNTVTWLAFWNDPINSKEFKYVFLAASSSLKGQSDKEKYEKARLLKDYIQGIRATYTRDFSCKNIDKRQIAVATYLIDKLALRAGNEKDDDEADTVGCCTLKVENVTLVPENMLKFDFLGKDSIRYENTVAVEPAVYKAVGQFQRGKKGEEPLFDQLDTSKLNAHLKELMPGLTAKVFRTYNASITLDGKLFEETKGDTVQEKLKAYDTANREVAIICNHQRTVSKSHEAQMVKLDEKISELKLGLDELKVDLSRAKKGKPPLISADGKTKRNMNPESIQKKIAQITDKIEKLEEGKQMKDQNKNVALGTSKINYNDPRITVAWCKRHEVPIEKVFNKSLLAKFAWAMDVDPDFRF